MYFARFTINGAWCRFERDLLPSVGAQFIAPVFRQDAHLGYSTAHAMIALWMLIIYYAMKQAINVKTGAINRAPTQRTMNCDMGVVDLEMDMKQNGRNALRNGRD